MRGVLFDTYLSRGWYPMHQSIFTITHFLDEEALLLRKVWWLRFDTLSLPDRTSHRRLRSKNSHFEVSLQIPFQHTPEVAALYSRYQSGIDFHGYESVEAATFPEGRNNIYDSRAWFIRKDDQLVACGIFHVGENACASILHFYDHSFSRFSLGRYMVLLTFDFCREQGIRWYYPGYVMAGVPKFDYKLFLGREHAQTFQPRSTEDAVIHPKDLGASSECWLNFHEDLLNIQSIPLPEF